VHVGERLASEQRLLSRDALMRERARTIGAEERGFTLPELLVATLLGLLVVGAAVTAFTGAIQSQPRVTSQAAAIQQARTTMEQITRELRQGSSVPSASATQLSIVTYVHSATCGGGSSSSSISCRVTYSCSGGTCTRTEANPDGTSPGAAVQVVSGLSSNNVFSYTPPTSTAPAYVGVTLAFPAKGGSDAITLTDGSALRNPGSGP
jgi:prepilin-type N-terminal cleavage/methylation domain-containing protein